MYKIFPLSLIVRLDAIFTLARHVQLKIMPIPLFKTKCYQILVSKPFFIFLLLLLFLPSSLRNCMNIDSFKVQLKTYLFKNVFKRYRMVQCQVLLIGGADIGQRVTGTFCFTGASYRAQFLKGRLVLNPGFFFFLQKHFFG